MLAQQEFYHTNALPALEAQEYALCLEQELLSIYFGPDAQEPTLFTSQLMRKKLLCDPNCLKHKNARDVSYSKAEGLCLVYLYLPLLQLKARLVHIYKQYYNSATLVLSKLDRPLYKPKDSIESAIVVDGFSGYSSFLCLSSPQQYSGMLELVSNYSTYHALLLPFLQYKEHQDKHTIQDFDLHYYNNITRAYTDMRNKTYTTYSMYMLTQKDEQQLLLLSVVVPPIWKRMEWVAPLLGSGTLIIWEAHTPYRTKANTMDTPFSGTFISFRVANREWYKSMERRDIVRALESKSVGTASKRSALANTVEYQHLLVKDSLPLIPRLTALEKLVYSIDEYTL